MIQEFAIAPNYSTLGTPLNIAAALREARGKYVTILNDDDLLEPQMLQRLVPPLEANPNVVAAFGNHLVMDADGMVLTDETEDLMRARGRNRLKPGPVPDTSAFAVRLGMMVGMGCVVRRSALDPSWLVSEVAGAYDYWLAIRLGQAGDFYFVAENVMRWRWHANSVLSTVSPDICNGEIYIYETLAQRSSSRLWIATQELSWPRVGWARPLFTWNGVGARASAKLSSPILEHPLEYRCMVLPGRDLPANEVAAVESTELARFDPSPELFGIDGNASFVLPPRHCPGARG